MDLYTILKTHMGTKMCRKKFSFISEQNKSTHVMPRPRKIEKTRNSVSGTFLKTDFSKNEKFIEIYIDCMSFIIFRPQEADLRLRK